MKRVVCSQHAGALRAARCALHPHRAGNWNERPWGSADWTVQFKAAMDEAGFPDTEILVPDGGGYESVLAGIHADPALGKALQGCGIGLHYPCNHRPGEERIQQEYGLKFW